MWRERLKRIAIIIILGGLAFWVIEAFDRWQETKKVAGASINLPTEKITQKIEDFGEKILGKAVEVLPGSEKIRESEKVVEDQITKVEIQPEKTTKILENQKKEIIEILKQLPEEQLKQIKRQIFKDFCQEVMGE